MPNYYNPYMQAMNYSVGYPNYAQSISVPPFQQNYTQPPMSSNVIGVDGEIGAKAYNIPNGSVGPIALWDTNDNVIYLRTFNSAGMPNPLRKLRYTEEEIQQSLPIGQSGSNNAVQQIDTSQFVTKSDFDELRKEIKALANQNGGNNRNDRNDRGRYTENGAVNIK